MKKLINSIIIMMMAITMAIGCSAEAEDEEFKISEEHRVFAKSLYDSMDHSFNFKESDHGTIEFEVHHSMDHEKVARIIQIQSYLQEMTGGPWEVYDQHWYDYPVKSTKTGNMYTIGYLPSWRIVRIFCQTHSGI